MITIRCCYCTSIYNDNSGSRTASGPMMRSKRFPSVFLHATCRWKIGRAFEAIEAPSNSLYEELVMKDGEVESYRQMFEAARNKNAG